MNPVRSTLALATAAAMLVAPAGPAFARGGDDVIRRSGSCTSNSNWELKGKHDDGLLEIEYEVDQNINGRQWRVRLTDNGERIFRGRRTTTAPSGSFTVEIRRPNLAGPDVIRARAVDTVTGEICRGRIEL